MQIKRQNYATDDEKRFSHASQRKAPNMEHAMRSLPSLSASAWRLQAQLSPNKPVFLDVETESKPGLLMKAY